MIRFAPTCQLRMFLNQLLGGEIDLEQYRLLRRGVALAYAEGLQQRRKARRAMQSVLESGELALPGWCEACGGPGLMKAHHPDSSNP